MAGVSPLRWLYLALALWGAVHPMAYLLRWFSQNGFDLPGLVAAWHANAATSGLVWDLTIAALALTLWIAGNLSDRPVLRPAALPLPAQPAYTLARIPLPEFPRL